MLEESNLQQWPIAVTSGEGTKSPRINIPMGKHLQIPRIAYAGMFCTVQEKVFQIRVVILAIRIVQREVIVFISLSIPGKNRLWYSKFFFRSKMSNKLQARLCCFFFRPEEVPVYSKSCLVFELCFSVQ